MIIYFSRFIEVNENIDGFESDSASETLIGDR